ncbi:MAG: hypothetical protein ACYTDW_10315 [Planctomycetota bacterium]|jgi:hypothetical protein
MKLKKPIIRDNLVDNSWPKFLHPYPLSDKYFLVSSQLSAKSPWGIYLVDVFDNILPIHVHPQLDLFEPIPLRKTSRPPAIPDRVDLNREDAVVYLHDMYAGPGLAGVPRGTVKKLRVVFRLSRPGRAGQNRQRRALGSDAYHWDRTRAQRRLSDVPCTGQYAAVCAAA